MGKVALEKELTQVTRVSVVSLVSGPGARSAAGLKRDCAGVPQQRPRVAGRVLAAEHRGSYRVQLSNRY